MAKKLNIKEKNPALHSMLSLAFYLVVIIAVWSVIGTLAFPQKPLEERVRANVEKYGQVFTQIAENKLDPTQWEGIMQSAGTADILSECNIFDVFADEHGGVVFAMNGKGVPENGTGYLRYCPNGEYTFTRNPSVWTELPEEGEMRKWVGGSNKSGYVHVWKMTDTFYLEVAVEPS